MKVRALVLALSILAFAVLHAASSFATEPGRIATIDKFATLKVIRPDGDGELAVADTLFGEHPQLSGDGRWIAYTDYRESDSVFCLYVVRVAPKGPQNQPVVVAERVIAGSTPAWHPEGKFLLFSRDIPENPGYGRVWAIRPFDTNGALQPESVSNPAVLVIQRAFVNYDAVAFAPDGKYIALGNGANISILQAVSDEGEITPFNNTSNPESYVVSTFGAYAGTNGRQPAWSPDGKQLLFLQVEVNPNPQLYTLATLNVRDDAGNILFENATTNPRTLLTQPVGEPYSISNPSWSPDGSLIAFNAKVDEDEFTPLHVYTLRAGEPEGVGNPRVRVTPEFGGGGLFGASFAQVGGPGDLGALPAPLPRQIVNWWPGDDTRADVVGSAHLTSQSGDPTYTAGMVGRALSFDGTSQSYDSETIVALNALPLTIEGWIKPEERDDANQNSAHPPNVVSNDRAGSAGLGFGAFVFPDHSELVIEVQASNLPINNPRRIIPGVTLNAGEWAHVAVVYTAGNARTYLNGVLVDSFDYTQGPLDGEDYVRIGRHNEDTSYGTIRFFKGAIDEISLYQRALPAEEIAAIVLAGSNGKKTDDASRQFVTGPQQEGSLWTYGSYPPPGDDDLDPSLFSLLDEYVNEVVGNGRTDTWRHAGTSDPSVRRNPSPETFSSTQNGSEIRLAPRQLSLHPGPGGDYAVVRWTAPAAGRYSVSGSFNGADSNPTTTQVHMYHNTTLLLGATISEFLGDGVLSTTNILAEAGDTVDFIVTDGGDGFSYDSTGLIARVTRTGPSPAPSNFQIVTASPPTNDHQWLFTAERENTVEGTSLRIQYATAAQPDVWTDLDVTGGTNSLTPPETGETQWALNVSPLPLAPGNYFFRAVATVPDEGQYNGARTGAGAFGGFTDDPIAVSGPGEPPPAPSVAAIPPTNAFSVKAGGKTLKAGTTLKPVATSQGQPFDFIAEQPTPPGMPAKYRVDVEYSTTPNDDHSWTTAYDALLLDVGKTKTGRKLRLQTGTVPAGAAVYFRTITRDRSQPESSRRPASAGPVINGVVIPVGPIKIDDGPSWDFFVSRVTSESDGSGQTAFVGEELTYRVRFRNGGNADAKEVVVKMAAPTGTHLVSNTTTDIYKATKSGAEWHIPSAAPNIIIIKEITVVVDAKPGTAIVVKDTNFTLDAKSQQNNKLLKIAKVNARPDSLRLGELLTTQVFPGLKITLDTSTSTALPGQTIDYTLEVENHSGSPLPNVSANFRLPFGTSLEYVRLNDGNGNFTSDPNYSPTPGTNPSVSAYVPGQRQLIAWSIGTIPAHTIRNLKFTLRVSYDLVASYTEDNETIPGVLAAGEYNATSTPASGSPLVAYKVAPASIPLSSFDYDGTNFALYPGGPPIAFTFISEGTFAQPPHLMLTKTATADGQIPSLDAPTKNLKVQLAGIDDVSTVLPGRRITYTLRYENKNVAGQPASSPGRNVTIHDEIPAGVTFAGFIKENGVPQVSSVPFTFRNADGLVIPNGRESWTDTNSNGHWDKGEPFVDSNGNKKYDDLTDVKFIDYNVGALAGGASGTLSYDVNPVDGLKPYARVIVSRSSDSIIPKSKKGLQSIGYSITSENLLTATAGNPRNLASIVANRGSLDLQPIARSVENLVPGGSVDYDIPFVISGGEGLTYPDVILTVPVPKGYIVETSALGYVNPATAIGSTFRPAFPQLFGAATPTVATDKKGNQTVTYSFGSVPGGAQRIARLRVSAPSTLPTDLINTNGTAKAPLSGRVALTGGAGVSTASPRAAAKAPAVDPVNLLVPTQQLLVTNLATAFQSDLAIGRIAPISVERGQEFKITVFAANLTSRENQTSKIAMRIPSGTRFRHADSIRWHYAGQTAYVERPSQYTLLPNASNPQTVVFDVLDMHPSDAVAVTFTLQVDSNFAGGSIEDVTLHVRGSKSFGRGLPKLVIKVPQQNFFTWIGSFFGDFFSGLFGNFPPAAADALRPYEQTLTTDSRIISFNGAQGLQLTNGTVLIPLLNGRSLVVGLNNRVTASAANILADDNGNRVVVGGDYTPGFKLSGIPQRPGSVFSPGDILTGLRNPGSSLVAAGAGNLVAAGAGNLIGLDGGTLTFRDNTNGTSTGVQVRPTGSGSLVAAGAGNLVAAGGGNIVAAGAGNLIGLDGGTLIGNDAGSLVAAGAGNLIGMDGASLVAAGGGNLVAAGGGNMVSAGGTNITANALSKAVGLDKAKIDINEIASPLLGLDGASIIGQDGASLLGLDGASIKP